MASFALVFAGTAILASKKIVHHHQQNKIVVRSDRWGWVAKSPALVAELPKVVAEANAGPSVATPKSKPAPKMDRIVTSRSATSRTARKTVLAAVKGDASAELKKLQNIHSALINEFELVALSKDVERKPAMAAVRLNTQLTPGATKAKLVVSIQARVIKPAAVVPLSVSAKPVLVSPLNVDTQVGTQNIIPKPFNATTTDHAVQDPELASRVQKLFASYFSKPEHGAPSSPGAKDKVELVATTGAKLTIQKSATTGYPTLTAQSSQPKVQPQTNTKLDVNTQAVQNTGGRVSKRYVEAFSLNTQISQVLIDEKSHFGIWTVLRAKSYIPTVASTHEDTVPLLSENSRRTLELASGAVYQSSSGIVYGELPDGALIEYSGRTEKPLLFDSNHNVLAPTERRGERTFVLLNAQPGANILRLINSKGVSEFAVRVPVFVGSATFVDLRGLSEKSIHGTVISAEVSGVLPVSRAKVNLPGCSAPSVYTDQEGAFNFSHLLTSSKYPLVFETESENGAVHRSQILLRSSAAANEAVTLYQFGIDQIRSWVSSLEGGVSEQSGLLVAAFPELVKFRGEGELFPVVRSLSEAPALTSETYLLSPTGQLMSREPMRAESARVVAVQLPEGLGLINLEDRAKKIRYSELFFASPGVVNVIGPQ